MRAAVLHEHGAPPVVEDRADPAVAPDRVLVRVTAATVYPLDLLYASGRTYLGAPRLPYVPGVQGVGVAPDGRRVWFATGAGATDEDGSYAQQCAADPATFVPLPDGLDEGLAAALGLSSVAAAGALARADVRPDETVAVLGASGVVGRIAVQLARSSAAARVVAVVRGPAAAARLADLGCEVVELGEDGVEPAAARLREATDGRLDVVIDPLWGLPAEAAFAALSPRGRLVNFGSSAGPTAQLGSAALRSREIEVRGYTNLSLTLDTQARHLAAVFALAASGGLSLPFEDVPLVDAADAWQRQAGGTAPTRIVLRPGPLS